MGTVRSFRLLAFINLAAGTVLAVSVIAALAGLLGGAQSHLSLFTGLFFTLCGFMAGSLIQGARRQLRNPNRKSTIAVARNTSVIAWSLVAMITGLFDDKTNDVIEHAWAIVAVAVGYSLYRFLLKPAALRAFSASEGETST